MQDDLTRC